MNNLGGSVRLLVQSPSNRPADDIPLGDLETVKQYGASVADIAKRLHG
jgi:NAD(P)H dehydrogenase (quinone)